MNESMMVRREERAIYTHSKIQLFRSGSEVPTQIAETFGPSVNTIQGAVKGGQHS